MPGNKIYVKGSYIDVHDNENVYLSVDKAEVHTQTSGEAKHTAIEKPPVDSQEIKEELFKFIHPAITGEEERKIHEEVKKLVTRQGIQEICKYLSKLESEEKVYLPQSADSAYTELVRMGMPCGDGFSLKTFMKYYKK